MKKLTLTFMFALFMCGLRAQSYELIIRLNDLSETTWNDESLRNIYFIDDEDILVVVENESLTTHQYNFAEINKIYFKLRVAAFINLISYEPCLSNLSCAGY